MQSVRGICAAVSVAGCEKLALLYTKRHFGGERNGRFLEQKS